MIKPNFVTNKWDGDLRLAFQFRPFIQNLLNTAGLSYILDVIASPRLIRPNQDYLIVANGTRIRNQQTEAFQDDHAEWEREIANIHAARLLIELDLGVNVILPNVPNAVQYEKEQALRILLDKTNPSTLAACPVTTINIDGSEKHFSTA